MAPLTKFYYDMTIFFIITKKQKVFLLVCQIKYIVFPLCTVLTNEDIWNAY